jgi:uncharacterized repeat protein (TIGR01451 family)
VQIDNVDYNTKLVIRPVQRGDSGEYTVTASNSSGKDTVTVNVVVTDKPTPPEGPLQVLLLLRSDLGCKMLNIIPIAVLIHNMYEVIPITTTRGIL